MSTFGSVLAGGDGWEGSLITPQQYKRYLEVSYLVLEYDMTVESRGQPPLAARTHIKEWRRELETLKKLVRAENARTANLKGLGEVPTGSSLLDLKERAQVAAAKAAQHAAAGHQSLARSWNNAAQRLRKELQARLRQTSLGELADLGISTGGKVIIGAAAVGAAVYGLYRLGEEKYRAERAAIQVKGPWNNPGFRLGSEHAEET